jgi:hypothetical protein
MLSKKANKTKKSLSQYVKDWIEKKEKNYDWTFNDYIVDDQKETIVCQKCKILAGRKIYS